MFCYEAWSHYMAMSLHIRSCFNPAPPLDYAFIKNHNITSRRYLDKYEHLEKVEYLLSHLVFTSNTHFEKTNLKGMS